MVSYPQLSHASQLAFTALSAARMHPQSSDRNILDVYGRRLGCVWAQAPDLVRSLCKGCRTRPRHLSWKAHGASTRSGAVASQLRPVEACPARRKRAQRRRREPRNGAIQSSTSSSLIVTGLSALIDDGRHQDLGLSSTLGRVCILDQCSAFTKNNSELK